MSAGGPDWSQHFVDQCLGEYQPRLYMWLLRVRYTVGTEFAIHHYLQKRPEN